MIEEIPLGRDSGEGYLGAGLVGAISWVNSAAIAWIYIGA